MVMEFFSHPPEKGQSYFLRDHLSKVADLSNHFLSPAVRAYSIRKLASTIALAHDFGKYTTFFQDRLLGKKDWGRKADHSFLSALFASHLVRHLLPENTFYPLLAYLVVAHHHTNLTSLEEKVYGQQELKNLKLEIDLKSRVEDIIPSQLNNIKSNIGVIGKELASLGIEKNLFVHFFTDWHIIFSELAILKRKFEDDLSTKERLEIYILLVYLFSLLIDADKKEAGKVRIPEREDIPPGIVERYRSLHQDKFGKSQRSELDRMRDEIYQRVTRFIGQVPIDQHLFTLTAPTGSGKTITAIAAALSLRERIRQNKNYLPRIIYSLPFITLIDQNYKVIRDILKSTITQFEHNQSLYLCFIPIGQLKEYYDDQTGFKINHEALIY